MQPDPNWHPTKFIEADGRLKASRDPKEVSVGSRVAADLIAAFYDRAIPQYAGGRLLDLGCGKAPFYGLYSRYAEAVTRVDWPNSLHGNPFIDVAHDLNEPLPFPDASFETILLSDVLEHLHEPSRCWSEMARVLSPGGKVILNVPFYYWLHEQPHDYYRYTEHALRRFAEGASLTIVELAPSGGAPEIMFDIAGKVLRRGRWGKKVSSVLPGLYATLARTRTFRKLSSGTSQSFPLAYTMVVAKS